MNRPAEQCKTTQSTLHLMLQAPPHWRISRLRDVARLFVSNVDKGSEPGEEAVRLCNYVDVYKNDIIHAAMPFMRATAQPDEIRRFALRIGDVVITKDSEDWKDIGVPAFVASSAPDLVCGYHLAILRANPHLVLGRYLYWLLKSPAAAYQFSVRANGVTRYGFSHGAIKEITVSLPSLDEQALFIRFLDHANRLIRRYIAAKRKLIALLNEQKQAIIQRAVTRGLNAAAGLKPTGLDWLGEMPAHWEIRRNGRLFVQRNQTDFAELPILEVSLKTGVRIRNFDDVGRKQVMLDRAKYKRAAKNDIAYNMMRMWQGAVGVAPVDGLVSPAYIVARPLEGTEPRYFAYLFRTADYMREVDRYSRGIVKDRNRLYWEDFKRMLALWPPPDEQVQIADKIEKATLAVDRTIERVQAEIALLREYRDRVIADVMSGKFDVRGSAELLPDEVAEQPEIDRAEDIDDEQPETALLDQEDDEEAA